MGKLKYLNLRKANKRAKFQGHLVSSYISYKKLAQAINSIDFGTVKNLSDLSSDYKNTPVVYREPFEFILRLVEFYLFVNEERLDILKSFEHFPCKEASSFLFGIVIGSAGVQGIGISVLISFIDVGDKIASSVEPLLFLGAHVDGNPDIVLPMHINFSMCSYETKTGITCSGDNLNGHPFYQHHSGHNVV